MIRGESGIWDRWKLFEELLVRNVEFNGHEVGPFAQRPMQPLRPSPPLNPAMITASEHIGNLPATELGGSCELWFLEQAGLAKTLRDSAGCIAHRPIKKSGDRLNNQARANLSPTQHQVTDTDLAVAQMLTHTMVDTLVPSAQQTETARSLHCGRKLMGHGLIESPPTRAEEQERARRGSGFDGIEDRLGFHHHARTATERAVVDRAMNV